MARSPDKSTALRGLWWLAALLIVSVALAAATFFTYRNAEAFARERLVRAAVLYTFALERGARHLGPKALEQIEELLDDATGEEVRGVAVVDRQGRVLARFGEAPPAERLSTADWVSGAARFGKVGMGEGGDDTLSVAVPSRLGCDRRPRHGLGRPHERWPGPRRPRRGGGPCAETRLAMVLTLDAAEAREPIRQARIQAAFVVVALALAWALAALWHRQSRRARRLEGEARRREKMAALGEMAAVMAHEIRNPLGAIRGHAQLLAPRLAEDESGSRSVRTVVDETSRLSRLVDGLLRYARPSPPEPRPVSPGALVDRALELSAELAAEAGVSLERATKGDGPEMACDPDQVEQVLLNLVRNAVQAQDEGGGGRVRVSFARAGEWVEVRVEDAGPGVPEKERERIFSPFVTTKAEGSGLGLAIARQIAEAHEGELVVEGSSLGGAALVLRLPAVER